MERRARATVFWPGMTQDFNSFRNSCVHCNHNAPPRQLSHGCPSTPPTTPFEHIFADYFNYGGRHFLVIGDKFPGWAEVFGTSLGSNIAGAAALVSLLRTYFATFGVPDQISTDGGPEFKAFATQQFLKTWVVEHRVSSAYFLQRAGRNNTVLRTNSHPLCALHCGDRVFLQNQTGNYPRKWDKVGTATEALGFDQCAIKVGGSARITKRYKWFLRRIPQVVHDTLLFGPRAIPIAHSSRRFDDT